MRMRMWIFAVVVALMLAINLGLVSLRIAQTGEETVRARVALAANALKGQLDLIDARLAPRAVAASPDLIEATRPPVDPTQPLGKPDERALRAAAAALSPDPDLLIVASAQGAIVSRRAKAAQSLDDVLALPLVKAGLEGAPPASFASVEGALYRVAVARIPGNAAVVIVGMLVDDRMAAQLRSQLDADVTLLQGGKPVASSLPAEDRVRLARWAAAPAPGYGVLQVRLPVIGTALSGRLPRGATRYAVRGALVPLGAGVQAALTVPASPYLGWLARYQAFYLFALVGFLLLSFLWGLLIRGPVNAPEAVAGAEQAPQHALRPRPTPERTGMSDPAPALEDAAPQPSLDVGNPIMAAAQPAPRDVPWREGEGPSGEYAKPLPGQPLEVFPPVDVAADVAAIAADRAHAEVLAAPAEELLDDDQPESTAVFAAPHAPFASEPDAGKSDFSFAGLLEDAHSSLQPAELSPVVRSALREISPDTTAPGRPSDELIALSKPDYGGLGLAQQEYFPGDEPTRIEPVSAALLDKLREKDDPAAGEAEALPESAIDPAATPPAGRAMPPADAFAMPAPGGRSAAAADFFTMPRNGAQAEPTADDAFMRPASNQKTMPAGDPFATAVPGPAALFDEDGHPAAGAHHEAGHTHEAVGDRVEPAPGGDPPTAARDITLSDFALATEADPDELHWQETFEKFRELKVELGEPADRITFESFATKLRKNRADLMAKHNCIGVRFLVYEKEGKAAIKASAVR